MRRAIRFKVWFVLANSFWLAMWLPGLWDLQNGFPRVEDVLSVSILLFGIVCELLDLWIARIPNVGFYLLYAFVPVIVYARDPSDVHAAFGVMFISAPYLLMAAVNFTSIGGLRRQREQT